jgi:hypothetical protein
MDRSGKCWQRWLWGVIWIIAWGFGTEHAMSQGVDRGPLGTENAVEVGVAGRYRPGRWMQVRVDNLQLGATDVLELETLDGDGVRYVQRHTVRRTAGSIAGQAERYYLPAGPTGTELQVRLLGGTADAGSKWNWSTRLLEGAVAIDRTWVVAIGSSLGIDRIGESELLQAAGVIDVSLIDNALKMPDHWYGYDGVDFIVVSGSGIELLQDATAEQRDALEQWVRGGGRIFVTLGERGQELFATLPWIARPGGNDVGGEVLPAARSVMIEPSAVESFISAREPLQRFAGILLEENTGEVILAGRSVDRQSLPLLWRRDIGFGTATMFAGGLDVPPLSQWKQRPEFLGKVLPGLLPERRQRNESRGRSDLRYSEMAGQLRATLDHFAGAGQVQFSVIAGIILVLAGIIGPLEFWFVNRVLRRPVWGWAIFSATIVLATVGLVSWRGGSLPRKVQQVSVIDLDPISGTGRGFSVAHLFVGEASRVKMGFDIASPFRESGDDQTERVATLAPWGYAGSVFGGVEIAGEDVRLPAYRWMIERVGDAFVGDLIDVPLAPQSSKSVAASWQFPSRLTNLGTLQRRIGSDLLAGQLVNPLEYDLADGYLVYRNLIYQLPTRVPAGAVIENIELLPAKNFRWRLNRRQTTEDNSESEPWDPGMDTSLARLMEVMMFYQAAGGASYVNLQNRTLGALDLTHKLQPEQAILVGRVREPIVGLLVDGSPLETNELMQEAYVRVLLPVEKSDQPLPEIPPR